jgi:hypothetical protein
MGRGRGNQRLLQFWHIRVMWQDILNGKMHADDYTTEAWKEASISVKLGGAIIKSLGGLKSLTLVDRNDEGKKRTYRYRVEFEKNTLLQRFVFDEKNKVVACPTEDIR